MIKNFLIINCTGKVNTIGLKFNNKYFINKLQTNLYKNEVLIQNILDTLKKFKIELDDSFSILINTGPGSFSGIRVSLSVAKGIALVKNIKIFGYNYFLLNIANEIKNKGKVISIQKTKNFYYFLKVNFKNLRSISKPKKIHLDKFINSDSTVIVPKELKKDKIFNKINIKKIKYVEFNLKNIDKLIKNNLLENKLIKPLYLS